jgi:hypothetical protein
MQKDLNLMSSEDRRKKITLDKAIAEAMRWLVEESRFKDQVRRSDPDG